MTAIIPAHRGRFDVDGEVLSALRDATAYIAAEVRDGDLRGGTARDLHRWTLGVLAEAGAQVGAGRIGLDGAEPFTEDELNAPDLLDDLRAQRRAAVAAFDADMLAQGAEAADLPSLREHYQPVALIVGAFLDRLIATLCALEAQCRGAATSVPVNAAARDLGTLTAEQLTAVVVAARRVFDAAKRLFAVLVLVAQRALETATRDRPAARVDPNSAQAVTLTRAARAPGAVASA